MKLKDFKGKYIGLLAEGYLAEGHLVDVDKETATIVDNTNTILYIKNSHIIGWKEDCRPTNPMVQEAQPAPQQSAQHSEVLAPAPQRGRPTVTPSTGDMRTSIAAIDDDGELPHGDPNGPVVLPDGTITRGSMSDKVRKAKKDAASKPVTFDSGKRSDIKRQDPADFLKTIK